MRNIGLDVDDVTGLPSSANDRPECWFRAIHLPPSLPVYHVAAGDDGGVAVDDVQKIGDFRMQVRPNRSARDEPASSDDCRSELASPRETAALLFAFGRELLRELL